MKPILSAIALLLLSSVNVAAEETDSVGTNSLTSSPKKNTKPKFLEGNEAAYDINAPCGKCIASGYNFCWKSEETGLILTDDQYPTATGIYETTNTMCCGEQSWYSDYKMASGEDYNPSTETEDEKSYPNRNCAYLMKVSRVID